MSFFVAIGHLNAFFPSASPEAIYRNDDRQDLNQSPSIFRHLGKSVAVKMRSVRLVEKDPSHYYINPNLTLERRGRICHDQRFAQQPAMGECTAFLVGPHHLVTAGHCMEMESDCDQYRWVFDYNAGDEAINKKNVYQCQRIYKTINEEDSEKDYALIILKRDVTNRAPLRRRKSKTFRVKKRTPVFAIGSPMGVPLKLFTNGRAYHTYGDHFKTNLDTFAGNSGSPVFNARTLKVEGLLTFGADDHVWNSDRNCYEDAKASGHQEVVYKINHIKEMKSFLKAKINPTGKYSFGRGDGHRP